MVRNMRGIVRIMSRGRMSSRGGRSEGSSCAAMKRPRPAVPEGRPRLPERFEQVLLQSVQVGVEDHGRAVGELHPSELVMVDQLQSLDQHRLPARACRNHARARPRQPVDTTVDRVAAALPGGAETAGQAVHLVQPRLVAVHLQVAARGQTSNARSDDHHSLGAVCASSRRRPWSHGLPPPDRCRGQNSIRIRQIIGWGGDRRNGAMLGSAFVVLHGGRTLPYSGSSGEHRPAILSVWPPCGLSDAG